MKIDLRKVFIENITYFWKIKATKTLGHTYVYTSMSTHAQDLRTHASCMRTKHAYAYTCMRMHARVSETMKGRIFYI